MSELSQLILRPGTLVAGKYEVIQCLGSGSMGVVYSARVSGLASSKSIVALKVLYPEVAKNPVLSARFRNEVLVAYGVNHANVVKAYEYIREKDLIAYSMEYVDGGDLADRLAKWSTGSIPYSLGLKWLWQMASGLQAIHEQGIVHRDLKPENILLTSDDQVKITDFGIAKTNQGPRLTEHGGVVGTLNYVSPEYILHGTVDFRSDIYALGLLAFEMFTGQQPFSGGSVFDMMTTRIKLDPPNPRDLNPQIHQELADIILKCLQRDPSKRYQNMSEILLELASFFEKNQIKFELIPKTRVSDVKVFEDIEIPVTRSNIQTENEPMLFAPVAAFESLSGETQALVSTDVNVAKPRLALTNRERLDIEKTEKEEKNVFEQFRSVIWIALVIFLGIAAGRFVANLLGFLN